MAFLHREEKVKEHLDILAKDYDSWKERNTHFYDLLKCFLRKNVAKNASVLEIGCRTGDMLASVAPKRGVGVDISPEMIKVAQDKYPQFDFHSSSGESFDTDEKFDYILILNVLGYSKDVSSLLENVHKFCHARTKVIVTTINPWWDFILSFAEKMKIKMPSAPHNFIEKNNLTKIIDSLDFSISYSGFLGLCPTEIPIISFLANTIGVKTLGINKLSFVQYLSLRPLPDNEVDLGLGCSVVIPCFNEEGNIEEAVRRIPQMGKGTEIIVVNDGSTDRTAEIVRSIQGEIPGLKLIDYHPNRGKGEAVKAGFDAATEEAMMILDADMTVPPEELPRFFKLLNQGSCGFVNGTRLIYPMQDNAMKKMNLLGNKVFGMVMSYLTGQHLTDTLCGTKALYKKDYKRIKMGADKWGDFDLLFGAAKNGDKILEVPIHYMSRVAGESKMKTLSHGIHLMKVCVRGFKELILGL